MANGDTWRMQTCCSNENLSSFSSPYQRKGERYINTVVFFPLAFVSAATAACRLFRISPVCATPLLDEDSLFCFCLLR